MRLFIGIEIPSDLKEEIFKIQKDLKKLNIKSCFKCSFFKKIWIWKSRFNHGIFIKEKTPCAIAWLNIN